MSALNNVSIQGRLSCDPELRYTQNGKAYCSISIFLENSYPTKDNTGGFIDVISFEQKAEFLSKYFSKGDAILICGSLKHDSWIDKESNKSKSKWSIVANSIHFCGKRMTEQDNREDSTPQEQSSRKQNNYQQPQYKQQSQQYSYKRKEENPPAWDDNRFDDEIPF